MGDLFIFGTLSCGSVERHCLFVVAALRYGVAMQRRTFLSGVAASWIARRVSAQGAPSNVWLGGENSPTHIAADESHLYWLNQGNTGCEIRRRALAGGAVETLGQLPGAGMGIVRMGPGLLLANREGTFFMYPLGAVPQQHIQVSDSVYGLEWLSGRVLVRTSRKLFAIENATGLSELTTETDASLAGDDRYLYRGQADGRIVRRAWANGEEQTLGRVRGSEVTGVHIDGSRLYFSAQRVEGTGPAEHSGGIGWLPSAGGDIQWRVEDQRVGWSLLHGRQIHYRVGRRRFRVGARRGQPQDVGTPVPGKYVVVGNALYVAASGAGQILRIDL